MDKDIKRMLSSLNALRKEAQKRQATINKATKELDDLTARLLNGNKTFLKS